MWEALTVCKGNLSKLEAKNDNLRNDIEIINIFRMYSFESTIPTNSSKQNQPTNFAVSPLGILGVSTWTAELELRTAHTCQS